MSWLDRHPDASWPRLAAGLVSPPERERLADHARACARCAPRYERAVGVQRVLEGRELFAPVADELAQFEHRGLERALTAARPARAARAWGFRFVGALAVGVALVLIVLAVRPPAPRVSDDLQWRGSGDAHAQVRAFCAAPGQPMVELVEGGVCPLGGVLAFAAAAPANKATAVVRLRGGGHEIASDSLSVAGRPGAEQPLDYTPHLDLPSGAATLEVGFGATVDEARAALEGAGERRTLHLVVRGSP
jgi:hypothetical protein